MSSKRNTLDLKEKGKIQAAYKVAKEFVFDDFVLGVGTGSTINYFIKAIAELIEKDELDIVLVPSSIETELELIRNGLSPSSLIEFPEINLYVDSAD